MSNEKFVDLNDEINKLPGKYYKVTFNDGKVKCDCIAYNEHVPELLIFLRMVILDYNVYCVQYTLTSDDITKGYLKMMGVMFSKKSTVDYSLDLINIKDTDELEIHLVDYSNQERKVIEKIEKYPGDEEILNYMLELLSHESVQQIFD